MRRPSKFILSTALLQTLLLRSASPFSILPSTLRPTTAALGRLPLASSSSSSSSSSPSPGEVGSGPNWIEKSFPVDTSDEGEAGLDPKKVEDYNLGINGVSLQVGPLGKRMYDAIVSRSSVQIATPEIQRAYKLYAMDFTAKEAVRAALKQNGLELVLTDDEQDEGMWGDVDSIRLLDSSDDKPIGPLYDSWEDAVQDWTPGQTFNFVVRQVPAKMRELSLDELLQALDPDGTYRQQAKDAGMTLPDEGIASLKDLANVNVRRTEMAPRDAVAEQEAYAGELDERGYQPIKASDLLFDSMNFDGTENRKTLMHVMDALVSHGCLLVDLTDGGTTFHKAEQMADMWVTTQDLFDKIIANNNNNNNSEARDQLPGMKTAQGTGSRHAKVGFASYENGNMQFLETRLDREGELLPKEAQSVLGESGCKALKDAFHVVADVGKDVVRIAVAASTAEVGALEGKEASETAVKLADELLDDGLPLGASDLDHSEGTVSMSPHRLCRYSNNNRIDESSSDQSGEKKVSTAEIFGAHTDSSFVTLVPVAQVAGLEVYDESAEKWYRPELAARRQWEIEQEARGKDPEALTELVDDDKEIPWNARYVVVLPGEMLQLVTRNEVPAAVHRVVATQDCPSRLSAPILLRGRPGTKMDVTRYLGDSKGDPLLEEVDGMTIEDIHDTMQPTSFQ